MSEPQFSLASPGANPNIQNYLSNRVDGKSMRTLKVMRESVLASARATGMSQPATILNFNPIALSLEGGITFKVPSIVDEAVPDDLRFKVKYKGKEFKASVMTINEPIAYPKIKEVRKEEDVEVGEYDMKLCRQIEIVHNYLVAYTEGTPSSSGMGGVIVFQGNRHSLKSKEIKVPKYIDLPDKSREYFTEEVPFEEELGKALEGQKRYCNTSNLAAQRFWDGDERNNITQIHRIWGQYAIDMGWRQEPWLWMNAEEEARKTCEGCGTPSKRASAFFCHNCARPYDAFSAYMAGELPIESVHLNRCTPDQWKTITAHAKKMKALREGTV